MRFLLPRREEALIINHFSQPTQPRQLDYPFFGLLKGTVEISIQDLHNKASFADPISLHCPQVRSEGETHLTFAARLPHAHERGTLMIGFTAFIILGAKS